jgi:hypothetical protein
MYAAVKADNPDWKPGQPFHASILDSVTRESVESNLVQSGNQFVKQVLWMALQEKLLCVLRSNTAK